MPTVADLCTFLDKFAPKTCAASWDNVGLLFGNPKEQVEKVMTCLTVTPESAREAVSEKVQLIVTHHPILFQGAKNITATNPEGKMLWDLATNNVAVYSPHTGFDNTNGGINDILANLIGLQQIRPLRPSEGAKEYKIVVFVPESETDTVSQAMFSSGAGRIGDYEQCSFRIPGKGTFFGSESTNPTVGQKGQLEFAEEIRLEVVCPQNKLTSVLTAMMQSHSYEEPAYDVYPLQPKPLSVGEGRVGNLPSPIPFQQLAKQVKEKLNAGFMHFVGEADQTVKRVAIACGAAGEFLRDAAKHKADVFLTGEMRFHDLLKAQTLGVNLLIPGHYATERIGVEQLADKISTQWADLTVWASHQETEPLQVVE